MANGNLFLKAVSHHDTVTENGALSHSSMGSAMADQFAKAANFRNRDYDDVCLDQEMLWEENAVMALRFPFYLRMITRKIKVNDGFVTDKVQNGQGVRDEAFKRLLWIAENHNSIFWNNIWVLPLVGSWKDLFQMMHYDMMLETNAINRTHMYELLREGISCQEHVELIKKFMPRIKSSSKLKTDWTKNMNTIGKEFADFMGWSIQEYNKFKATGVAHNFQKEICGGMYENINWNVIPGRALNLLVNSKFLENHNLVESYTNWLMEQPVAKYTGYVYELATACNEYRWGKKMPLYKKITLDKQFQSLIEKAQADGTFTENVWCALDTSGSMTTKLADGKTSAMDVCMSLGVFFSTLNQGAFHKNVIMFDNKSTVKQLNGSFTDMMSQVPMDAMGGTNFQSVVDEICRVRRERPNIPLEDYPSTLLIVSDMQFNPVETRYNWDKRCYERTETNFEAMKRKMYEVFPQDFVDNMKFIWWNVSARNTDFPTRLEDGGSYMLSGFDGSVVNLILQGDEKEKVQKTPKTMEELIEAALTQEILLQVKLS
jgi:hypothetical protein